MKRFILTLAFLGLVGISYAQQGIALNPNFAAPMQYVQTAGNNYELLPTAGLEVALGYVNVVNNSVVDSLGLFLEGNVGQTSTPNTPSIFNTIGGLQVGFGPLNATLGLQLSGTPLGGSGSSGVVIGASYDITQIFGTSAWLFKF